MLSTHCSAHATRLRRVHKQICCINGQWCTGWIQHVNCKATQPIFLPQILPMTSTLRTQAPTAMICQSRWFSYAVPNPKRLTRSKGIPLAPASEHLRLHGVPGKPFPNRGLASHPRALVCISWPWDWECTPKKNPLDIEEYQLNCPSTNINNNPQLGAPQHRAQVKRKRSS